MYPDPVTPKSDPDTLQQVDYDPYGLMPKELPPHPRVFITARQVERARGLIASCDWAGHGLKLLKEKCKPGDGFPARLPVPSEPKLNQQAASLAMRCALAHLLTGEEQYRERGAAALRMIAVAYPRWLVESGARGSGASLDEGKITLSIARTYDMLSAGGLDESDDTIMRDMLYETRHVLDDCPHRSCGNHNTHCLKAILAVGLAMGDAQRTHDALYGCERAGQWRHGIIHQLRHDWLSDGIHWEGTLGYHFYTLMGTVEIAWMMANVGVDLWHAQLPPLQQSDGKDLHRAYGPAHGTKCLKAAFDAPFYQTFAGGDISLLHDSGLANLRGHWIWGPIYDMAWEAYGDPKYAWLLSRTERDYPPAEREHPELPMSLNTHTGDLDFARLRTASYPDGEFSLQEDCAVSLVGRHEGGCTLFPVHGSAVMRCGEVGAFIYWGPHVAGHMGPAALHLDVAAGGRRITDSPRSGGYSDPNHLTWCRTTIAHNTVTVDEAPMFPYDFETDSIWEADSWRDRISDGALELFQPADGFKAVRASNENVYPGVRLDRTVVVTERFVLDAYRVLSDVERTYDWAAHCVGEPSYPDGATPFDPGQRRGYRHLADAVQVPLTGEAVGVGCARILPPVGSTLIMARDPIGEKPELGELDPVGPRTSIIVRTRAESALFLSLWTFGGEAADLALVEGDSGRDVVVTTCVGGRTDRWRLPFSSAPVGKQTG